MGAYDTAVQKNMTHMNSQLSDWAAVPVKGMVEAEGENGTTSMPEFDFPAGYTPAPSLYKNNGTQGTCELCGHPIKYFYWIQNDDRRWVMPVGSECIHQFEGKSGQQMAKEVVWEANRQLLREAIEIRKAVWAKFSSKVYRGYGRYDTHIKGLTNHQFLAYHRLKKLTDGRVPDDQSKWVVADSNGVVTRWVNSNGDEVRDILAELQPLL